MACACAHAQVLSNQTASADAMARAALRAAGVPEVAGQALPEAAQGVTEGGGGGGGGGGSADLAEDAPRRAALVAALVAQAA